MPPVRWTSVALKTLLALAIILAIGLPWVIAMQHRLPGGLRNTFQHDVLKRMTQPLEQHKGPPGYYLLFSFVSFFPWCLLLPTTIKIAWRNRRDPLLRFSLAAVIGPWIMFELIQTKLPHYVLPCFPFLAILVADTVTRAIRREHDEWTKPGWIKAVGIFCVILVLLGLGPWAATNGFWTTLSNLGLKPWRPNFDRLPYAAMAMLSVAAVALAARIFYLFAKRPGDRPIRALAVTMIILMSLLFGGYLPSARFLHLSEDVGAYLQSVGATSVGDVYMIDYKEDSLPFYQGGTIRPQRKNTYLEETPPADWATWYVVTREIWDQTPDAARQHLDVLKTFHGWAYAAKGRVVDVMVLKKK
jgi:4-amino-4-deoxy-L-arabinose transferase-like glycosyltransferase